MPVYNNIIFYYHKYPKQILPHAGRYYVVISQTLTGLARSYRPLVRAKLSEFKLNNYGTLCQGSTFRQMEIITD